MLSTLLNSLSSIDATLDSIDVAELDRAIESLEMLRTLASARRSARERIENGKRPSQAISLATLTREPEAVREQCEERRPYGKVQAIVVEWLRENESAGHESATVREVVEGTKIAHGSVHRAMEAVCHKGIEKPYRYWLKEEFSPPELVNESA